MSKNINIVTPYSKLINFSPTMEEAGAELVAILEVGCETIVKDSRT
jgi:hypothetical protein